MSVLPPSTHRMLRLTVLAMGLSFGLAQTTDPADTPGQPAQSTSAQPAQSTQTQPTKPALPPTVYAMYTTQENIMVKGQIKTLAYPQRIPLTSLTDFDRFIKTLGRPARQGRWIYDDSRKDWIMRDEVGYEVAPLAARTLYKQAMGKGLKEFALPVSYIKPSRGVEYFYRLGIRQMLSEATTRFAGSSNERAFNVALGASKLNGYVIAKGTVFSFAKAMGDVSEATGFKKAFVISGEQTVEGVGGGMCQVSTTTFRAAYFAGLPIVERRPHSYQVRYYLPTGLDATVFLPQLDLKFRNDTPGAILIQTAVRGQYLTFRFFGTKDRTASYTQPVTLRTLPAPATRFIVTNDLRRGRFMQVDFAADGATINVYRTVKFFDGSIKRDTLTSVYKPWGAVWLVGPGTRLRSGRVLWASNDDAVGNNTYKLLTQTH